MERHPRARLSAYCDGELAPDDAAEVERHLAGCTECGRELALMRELGGVMRTMSGNTVGRSVWSGVHRQLTRPIGWVLLLAGATVWVALLVAEWLRAELTLGWAAATAMVVGVLLLLVGIGHEQLREWQETRYRDVEQ
jgi:anti-sigma factor RsiW